MGVLNIVLHEPEIPANTGNIGRTCVATGTRLHLIEPLGFRLNEKAIKRAGMDYWEHLDVTRYLDYEDFLKKNPGAKIYYATTKAPQTYTDVQYVWQGECGNPGGYPGKQSGNLRADPDDRRYPFPEFKQFSCHCALGGAATA